MICFYMIDHLYLCIVLRLYLVIANITMMDNFYMIMKMMFKISSCLDFVITYDINKDVFGLSFLF